MKTRSRYEDFVKDGKWDYVPFITIPKQNSDCYVVYDNRKRLDNVSYECYKDPNYGWLILQANPEYGSLEYNIPNGVILRIPFPLESVLNKYREDIKKYRELYG